MDKKTFWNKALILSVIFHLGVIPLMGMILNDYFSTSSPPEKRIELELIRSVSAKSLDNEQPSGQSPEIRRPQQTEQKPSPVKTENKKIEPIAKDNQAITDRTVPSSAENSGEKSIGESSQTETSGSGQGNSSAATGGGGQSGEYIRPQLLSKVEPVYPEKARTASKEGTVSVSLEVLSNGKVGSVTVRQSSGHSDLDDAAVKAVKRWRFVPAKDSLSGQSITCFVNLPVVFRLK